MWMPGRKPNPGDVFGRLTILEEAGRTKTPNGTVRIHYWTECGCGNLQLVNSSNFRKTKACAGCRKIRGASYKAETREGSACKNCGTTVKYAAHGSCVHCAKHGPRKREKRNRDPVERLRAQRNYLAKPEKQANHQALGRRRRARKRAAPGHHTGEQISNLYRLQGGKCVYCSSSLRNGFHADHIMPLIRGGSNDIRNIQLTCPSCNCKKSTRDPLEFAQMNGFLV